MTVKNNIIEFRDEPKQGQTQGMLRARWGYDDGNDKYIFELYDANGNRNMYLGDDGNLTMRGVFKTGEDGEARTVIDGNGIRSYNEDNELHGLVANPDGRLSDFIIYYLGKEGLKFFNNIDGYSLYCFGKKIATFHASGRTSFESGASGSFTTFDGKTVAVSGGLITNIS